MTKNRKIIIDEKNKEKLNQKLIKNQLDGGIRW